MKEMFFVMGVWILFFMFLVFLGTLVQDITPCSVHYSGQLDCNRDLTKG